MRRRFLSAAAASAVVAAALVIPASGSAAAGPAAGPATKAPAPRGRVTPGPTITLLTGDTVRLDKAADGTETGTVVKDASGRHNIVFQQMNGDLYALNGQIVRLISQGRLDRQLFDLTLLAKDGYDDAHTKQLPVITTYQAGHFAARAAAPRWTAKQHTLSSIRAQAQSVRKDNAATALADLTRSGSGVAKVWLDGKAHTSLDVTVPAVGAPSAWAAGYTGKGVKVAVVDTGIDATHPDLKGRVVAQHRFVDGDPNSVDDDNGHGTHVASTIAGTGAASGGKYRGVAPDASLVIGKVCDQYGGCPDSAVIAGMQWAADQGAKVINMSLGSGATDGTDPMSQALNQISDASGALFVVAAGNSEHGVADHTAMLVSAPGAADRALAVAAMSKTDSPSDPRHVAFYSSRGPRRGDFAIKPEISAPGGEPADGFTAGNSVVAARAAHGYEGTAVDQYYTAMAGTSMATPHVAGGAALLVQQHPDWTRDQLKDALVSSAKPDNLPNDAVTGQGGGMLDLKQATAGGLVATGTLNIGKFAPPYPATATGTVTFRNPGTKAVHADLKLNLFHMDKTLWTQTAVDPGSAVTLSPSAVDVAAGGTATATVTVNLTDTSLALGSYYGYVEANTVSTGTVRTTIGFTKDPQRATLSVRGIDRQGVPETSGDYSFVTLMDLQSGQVWPGWFDNGVGTFDILGADPKIPVGTYAVIGNIADFSPAPVYWPTSMTLGGDPELNLTKDTTLTIDARQGKQVQFHTNRPTEKQGVLAESLEWQRTLPTGDLMAQYFFDLPDFYLIPGGTATTGTFTTNIVAHLAAPSLTMAAQGNSAPTTLHALYPIDYCAPGACVGQFRSPGTYPVVDAGAGTPAELATAKVTGKVAIVHEPTHTSGFDTVDQVAADAAAASAAGVLFAVYDAGPNWRYAVNQNTIPVAVLTHTEGEQLATAAKAGPVTITTGGHGPFSPYMYALNEHLTRQFPGNPTFQVDPKTLATITARYHADTPGTVTGGYFDWPSSLFVPGTGPIKAPYVQTQYVSPGSVQIFSGSDEVGDTTTLTAGQKVTADYGTGPIAPGPRTTLTTSTDRWNSHAMTVNSVLSVGNTGRYENQTWDYPGHVRYLQNGQVLCDITLDVLHHNPGCGPLPSTAGPGRYQVEVDHVAARDRQTSTTSHTVWDVNATFNKDPELLPMVALTYGVPLDLANSVAGGSEYTAKIKAAYQTGYTGSGPFTLHAWASNDGGTTWTDLGTHNTGKTDDAPFDIRTPKGTKTVTLRVTATDTHGNSIDQTITNAWNVH